MVFVFILRFHRPFEKIKIRCEAQILCLFYASTDRLRKLRSACESFASLLLLDRREQKIKNCSENWKFPLHWILYSMDTCFWWLPSSKWSWIVGNRRLHPNTLGVLLTESCWMAYDWCFWKLRWGISSLPRNFLTRWDISCSEVTILIDIPFFLGGFRLKHLLK